MRVALGIAPTWLTIVLLLLCLTTTLSHAQRLTKRDHDTYDYFALHLNSSAHRPDDVARWLGARHEGQIGELEDHHTFSVPKEKAAGVDAKLKNVKMRRKKRRSMGLEETSAHVSNAVLWSQKMNLKPPMVKRPPPPPSPEDYKISSLSRRKEIKELVNVKKDVASALSIKDPSFMGQWHLLNTRQPGHDLNVTGLWLEGITGNGSITAIIDDGLDMYSQDLRDNYYAKGSYDFNNQVDEPKPRLSDDRHGTRCAGEVAAVRNDVCGVGVAYDAKVAGIRILSAPISEADEAASINYGYQDNQ
ncbi:pheromone processing endoprotease, partial [Ascosphaera atra]